LALSPSSASPVLKTKIQISLQSDFPLSLQRDDFSVKAISQSNSSYIRLMNVIQVDDAAKTLTVMFGGAYSGSYNIYVRHASIGLIKTSSL
jgi:Ulp1 family protease